VKANPARSENVITSSNAAYGHFQISRQECNTKEEEKEKRWNKRKQGTFRYIRLFKLKQIATVNIATLYTNTSVSYNSYPCYYILLYHLQSCR